MSRRRRTPLPGVRPARLRPGDRVAVVAPSGPVDPDRLERGCALLRGWGLDVTVGRHARDRRGYLAGGDEGRAADLQAAWLDPDVAGVLCARGGYGVTRLLDRLDLPAWAAAPPKLLLGSSDVTALHDAVGARLGLVTLFGPMVAADVVAGEQPDPVTVEALRRALFEPQAATVLAGPGAPLLDSAAPPRALAPGTASGPLVGGTLTLLAASVGTPYARPARDAIAVLEDVHEAPYRLDRYLTQLLHAGWFAGVRGIVLGSWVGCGGSAAEEVLAERLLPLGVPVLAGLAFGHGVPQLTVPLGATATLDADAGTLVLDEPALA